MARRVNIAASSTELDSMKAKGRPPTVLEAGGLKTVAGTNHTIGANPQLGFYLDRVVVTCVEGPISLLLRADDGAGGDVEDWPLGYFGVTHVFEVPIRMFFAPATRLVLVPAAIAGQAAPDKYSVLVDFVRVKMALPRPPPSSGPP